MPTVKTRLPVITIITVKTRLHTLVDRVVIDRVLYQNTSHSLFN